MKNNLVLIGMPGAGKSTAGVVLAKTLGYDFIDTDILLGRRLGMTLQSYIDRHGIEAFLKEEECAALSLDCEDAVIATGGSMVLSEVAMSRLKSGSVTVFFDIPLEELKKRLRNIKTRGIALRPGQTIKALFTERRPLYERYADLTVPARPENVRDLEGLVGEIVRHVKPTYYNL
jgi:shikimate kinase